MKLRSSRDADKLTLVLPERLRSFGDWIEQLIAESTGKEATGVVPVVGEPLGGPEMYGDDRLFVVYTLGDETGPAASRGHRGARDGPDQAAK